MVYRQGFRECVPNQKAGGVHFVIQNAYLAKTLGVKRRQSFQDRRGFAADKKQTGKEIKTGNAGA